MEELNRMYEEVFDENGNVKPCGRNKCMQLMKKLSDVGFHDLGNMDTGMMNAANIKSSYQFLQSSAEVYKDVTLSA